MDYEKVYAMKFEKIYPLLTAKAEKKGRTREEVQRVICWLTGYTIEEIENAAKKLYHIWRLFSKCACIEPGQKTDKRRRLRGARGRHRRAAHAGNPVSGQAGR